jgi:hypothetical protein
MNWVDRLQWGTVPSYFGGVAFLATIFIILRDRSTRLREQAAKVAAWVTWRNDDQGVRRYIVILRNGSDLPVTGVRLVVGSEKTPPHVRLDKSGAPEGPLKSHFDYFANLGPGFSEEIGRYNFTTPLAIISLEFTDCAGRRWIRTNERLSTDSRLQGFVRRRLTWPFLRRWRRFEGKF